MTKTMMCGKIVTVPTLSFMSLDGNKQVYVCKFVICSYDGVDFEGEPQFNFFEAMAFEDTAKEIAEKYKQGVKVSVFGKMVNHVFKDANYTSHYTNILLVSDIEYADAVNVVYTKSLAKKNPEDPVEAEIKQMNSLFSRICKNGFLCIDENDYYKIASNNMEFVMS